jgi:CheY-like chemotaxis protein
MVEESGDSDGPGVSVRWKKAEILAKAIAGIGIPLILVVFTWLQQSNVHRQERQRHQADIEQRRVDQATTLVTSLGSENERERLIALTALNVLAKQGELVEEFHAAVVATVLFEDDEVVREQATDVLAQDLARTWEQSEAPDVTGDSGVPISAPPVPIDSIASSAREITNREAVTQLRASTVLWVDDNPANNEGLRRSLERLGTRVAIARSTAEALEQVSAQQFSLIISDMGRAGDNLAGYTLLDSLRGLGLDTPFIIYARSTDLERHNREAIARGAVGQASSPNRLLNLVGSVLQSER